jgi:hypothetical protein
MPAFRPRQAVARRVTERDRISDAASVRSLATMRGAVRFAEFEPTRVEEVIPASVRAEARPLGGEKDACGHVRSRGEIHICEWVGQPPPAAPPLRIWFLKRAWVFGGTVIERGRGWHRGGLAMLTAGGGVIGPSRIGMDGKATLPAGLLDRDGEDEGRWRITWPQHRRRGREVALRPRRLRGPHFLLGNASGHFGHFLLEGMARLWALERLDPRLAARLKVIVYEPELQPFARVLLELAGIDRSRIVHASPVDRVAHLVAADPAMRTHQWVAGEMQRTWRSVVSHGPDAPTRRIYLSRRANRQRSLTNEDEIEELFSASGFEIIRPESLGMPEQIALADAASHLVGPVGSQMYLAAFQRPGTRTLVLAPPNFYLKDDVLLASAGDRDLRVVFGSPVDLARPSKGRRWNMPLERVAEAIRDLVSASADAAPSI